MSLRDELQKPKVKIIDALLAGDLPCTEDGRPFSPDELRELGEILRDRDVASSSIASLIIGHGYAISDNTVTRYRKRLDVSK